MVKISLIILAYLWYVEASNEYVPADDGSKIRELLPGKYRLINKSKNYEEYLKWLGVSDKRLKEYVSAKPLLTIKQKNDGYEKVTKYPSETRVLFFRVDGWFEEELLNGEKNVALLTSSGTNLRETIQSLNREIIIKSVFDKKGFIETIEFNGKVCTLVYQRL